MVVFAGDGRPAYAPHDIALEDQPVEAARRAVSIGSENSPAAVLLLVGSVDIVYEQAGYDDDFAVPKLSMKMCTPRRRLVGDSP